jgi:hypothetical protein
VAREARDVAVRLGRLVEAVELAPVDGGADAGQQRTIDENAVLPAGRFGDGPLRNVCHWREMMLREAAIPGSGRVSPSRDT